LATRITSHVSFLLYIFIDSRIDIIIAISIDISIRIGIVGIHIDFEYIVLNIVHIHNSILTIHHSSISNRPYILTTAMFLSIS